MSARPVVKTSHMNASMQEFAIMAAQVEKIYIGIWYGKCNVSYCILLYAGFDCELYNREWDCCINQAEIWATVSINVRFRVLVTFSNTD